MSECQNHTIDIVTRFGTGNEFNPSIDTLHGALAATEILGRG